MTILGPVTRNRASGWTADRQAAFLDALFELGSVAGAAARVALSASSAYRLRKQRRGTDFAAAWDATLAARKARLIDELLSRVAGRAVPQVYRGRIVGERVVSNNRLLLSVLGQMIGPAAPYDEDAAHARLAEAMDALDASLKFTELSDSATIP